MSNSGLEGLAAREAQVVAPKAVKVCGQCRGSKYVKVDAKPYPLTVACSCTVAPDSVLYVTVSVH